MRQCLSSVSWAEVMRNTYLSEAVHSMLHTFLGWMITVLLTTFVGLWLGRCISARGWVSPHYGPALIVYSPVACLFFPQIFLDRLTLILTWHLPLRFESGRLKIIMAALNFIAWM